MTEGIRIEEFPAPPKVGDEEQRLLDLLASRQFDYANQPAKPEPVLTFNGHPLSTAGNLTNVQAGIKAGKSAAIGAVIAATIRGKRQGGDCLGFESDNPEGKAVLHFDTEQSRFDADALIRRSVKRAGVSDSPPPWLLSYSMADVDIADRRKALRVAMDQAHGTFGGVHAVIIDGVADLCHALNDDVGAFDLVGELHKLAIRFDCPILTVLHENPGSEHGKTRGHLGSQLERKAETNLRLVKDGDGITTIYTERSRHCYIPKAQGLCFHWSESQAMHVTCGTAGELVATAKRAKMRDEAELVMNDHGVSYSELVTAIMDRLDLKERASKTRVSSWKAEGIIRQDESKNLHLVNP